MAVSPETSLFAVQRGDTRYGCLGSDLADKLQSGDLLAVTRGNVTYKLEVEGPMPWEEHDGGVWHVKNGTDEIKLYHTSSEPAFDIYTVDGKFVRNDDVIGVGEEVVILSTKNCYYFFYNNSGNWDFGDLTDTSKVENFASLFESCSGFNSPVDFDLSSATSIFQMFKQCTSFNQDLSGLNINNGKITSLYGLFQKAGSFEGYSISGWDTSNVTDMSFMFASDTWNNNSAFVGDLSSWDVSKVTTMSQMFSGAMEFNNDISGWNTSQVTNMHNLFYYATKFNQDLSKWCVKKITSRPMAFDDNSAFEFQWDRQPQWSTCPRGEDQA